MVAIKLSSSFETLDSFFKFGRFLVHQMAGSKLIAIFIIGYFNLSHKNRVVHSEFRLNFVNRIQ